MSDTPRTDELAKREFVPDGLWIKHARELERENAALRADKERLDWLDEKGCWLTIPGARNFISGASRAVIDAARKEVKS